MTHHAHIPSEVALEHVDGGFLLLLSFHCRLLLQLLLCKTAVHQPPVRTLLRQSDVRHMSDRTLAGRPPSVSDRCQTAMTRPAPATCSASAAQPSCVSQMSDRCPNFLFYFRAGQRAKEMNHSCVGPQYTSSTSKPSWARQMNAQEQQMLLCQITVNQLLVWILLSQTDVRHDHRLCKRTTKTEAASVSDCRGPAARLDASASDSCQMDVRRLTEEMVRLICYSTSIVSAAHLCVTSLRQLSYSWQRGASFDHVADPKEEAILRAHADLAALRGTCRLHGLTVRQVPNQADEHMRTSQRHNLFDSG